MKHSTICKIVNTVYKILLTTTLLDIIIKQMPRTSTMSAKLHINALTDHGI